ARTKASFSEARQEPFAFFVAFGERNADAFAPTVEHSATMRREVNYMACGWMFMRWKIPGVVQKEKGAR
ncbi:MAG TPA: hypothetical protein VHX49_06130, partial [Candidatus Acidoferrales bacterium]|nr:hypothetical protein [Candidatus Acidoferrales bacterium]